MCSPSPECHCYVYFPIWGIPIWGNPRSIGRKILRLICKRFWPIRPTGPDSNSFDSDLRGHRTGESAPDLFLTRRSMVRVERPCEGGRKIRSSGIRGWGTADQLLGSCGLASAQTIHIVLSAPHPSIMARNAACIAAALTPLSFPDFGGGLSLSLNLRLKSLRSTYVR